MKKWVPTIIAIATALAPMAVPALKHLLANHEEIMQLILGLYAVYCHTAKSPLGKE